MNRIDKIFAEGKDLLSIYFTAGFPELDSTRKVLSALQKSGVDFVEIGMQIAESISPKLAKEVLSASVNGQLYDLMRPINQDSETYMKHFSK